MLGAAIRTRLACSLIVAGVAASILLWPGPLIAQQPDYPARNITVVLGYGAGGGADTSTRYFAERLSRLAGKPVIVENRPGAQATLAAEAAARARPDGYTVLFAAGNALAASPHMFKKLGFDPLKSFAYVTTLFRTPYVLAASPKRDVQSVSDLTVYLKSKSANATGFYGYQGLINQAAGELYKVMSGANATPVPYKTAQQLLTDLMSGDVDFAFLDSTFALEQGKAGHLRALAVTLPERTPLAPDLPGMREAGLPGFDLSAWFAVYLPAGTPEAIVAKLNTWLNQTLASDEARRFLETSGTVPFPGSPEALAKYQAEQGERWGMLVKAANIEPQ
jgi:tripartite-type tricarboxylate transporter receptor subunit TctC